MAWLIYVFFWNDDDVAMTPVNTVATTTAATSTSRTSRERFGPFSRDRERLL